MVASPTTTATGTSFWGTTTNMATSYKIVPDPRRNRIYITGDTSAIRELLNDIKAHPESVLGQPGEPVTCPMCDGSLTYHGYPCRCNGTGKEDGPRPVISTAYWLASHRTSALRAALDTEAAYQAERAKEREAWEAAKAVIPSAYKTRHGAALGGVVTIDGESISEPAMDSRNLPWMRVASYERRVRDLTGQSSINGRVMDSDTLYTCQMADGRAAFRIAHYGGFGDDLRETYYLPEDTWARLMTAEVQLRKITRETATEWLDKYRGCVGIELYEFAMSMAQTLTAPAPGTLSVRREIGAGT